MTHGQTASALSKRLRWDYYDSW